MNTIVTLFLALAPLPPTSQPATTAAISQMADARAEQLAATRVAESSARMYSARATLIAPAYRHVAPTTHAPTLARTTATVSAR